MDAWNIALIDGRGHARTTGIAKQHQRSGRRHQIARLDIALDDHAVDAGANHILVEARLGGMFCGTGRPAGGNRLVSRGARNPSFAKQREGALLGERRAAALRRRLIEFPALVGIIEF